MEMKCWHLSFLILGIWNGSSHPQPVCSQCTADFTRDRKWNRNSYIRLFWLRFERRSLRWWPSNITTGLHFWPYIHVCAGILFQTFPYMVFAAQQVNIWYYVPPEFSRPLHTTKSRKTSAQMVPWQRLGRKSIDSIRAYGPNFFPQKCTIFVTNPLCRVRSQLFRQKSTNGLWGIAHSWALDEPMCNCN